MAWFGPVSQVVAGALALATWYLSTGHMVGQRARVEVDDAGRAWVEERPGGGARFVVELPEVTE